MKHSRRNIPDAISPQNPLNKTDITPDRIQDQLEEKTSIEDIFRDENELTRHNEFKITPPAKDDECCEGDEAGL